MLQRCSSTTAAFDNAPLDLKEEPAGQQAAWVQLAHLPISSLPPVSLSSKATVSTWCMRTCTGMACECTMHMLMFMGLEVLG